MGIERKADMKTMQGGAQSLLTGIKQKMGILTTCKHNSTNWVITTERVICVECERSMQRAYKMCLNVAKLLWVLLFLVTGCTKRITNVTYNPQDVFTVVASLPSDSLTDAAPGLQNAINSLPATGGEVRIEDGVHLIASCWSVNKSNVKLRGTGMFTSTLKVADSSNQNGVNIANHNRNIELLDFQINGNQYAQSNIWCVGVNANGNDIYGVKARYLWIRNTKNAGIIFANGASDGEVYRCVIDSTGPTGNTNVNVGFGVHIISGCKNIWVQENTFTGTSATACVRVNNGCGVIRILNNGFYHNDHSGYADRRAVFVDGPLTRCWDIVVSGSKIKEMDENGLFLNDIDGLTADDNDIDSAGYNGIEVNGSTDVKLRRNDINRCRGEGMSLNQNKGALVEQNTNVNCGKRGIHVYAAGNDSTTDIILNDNHCYSNSDSILNTWHGIEVGVSYPAIARRITVTNNDCVDQGVVKSQKYGMQITNDVDYYILKDNILNPNATGGLNDGGTGMHKTVEGNQ